MIKSLHIERLRPFDSLELTDLKRVNILVGTNASGKTSLLEAIKVGLDAVPGTLPWLNGMRGMNFTVAPTLTADQFRELFIDWFHEFDSAKPISIRFSDSSNQKASLKIYFDPQRAATSQPSVGFRAEPSLSIPTTIIPLVFDRTDFQGQKTSLLATINPQGQFTMEPGRPMGISSGFFSNNYFGFGQENAAWLSRLRVEKRGDEVIGAIQRHFSFIRDVTSEITGQGMATVFVDVPHLPRKIPLSLVSGGISRLFTLILAVVTFGAGVVLIDEVENGIFHDQYHLLWKTLTDLAEHNNTQLFVATHSGDCLRAAHQMIAEREAEFSLLRIVRKNGVATVKQFSGKELESALDKDGEVRG